MGHRARSSGVSLSEADAAIVKAMLARGDRQHDIAAWFGVNGGRVAEVATRKTFSWVKAADGDCIPPPGPYPLGRDALAAMAALVVAERALDVARRHLLARAVS